MLWIAALAGVTAVAVLVVLVSHTGERARVTPLREEKTSAKPRSEPRKEPRLETGWLVAPKTLSRTARRPAERASGSPAADSRRRRGRGAAEGRARRHEGIRPVQSTSPGTPRKRATQQPAIVTPVAAPVSAPSSAPAPAAEPPRSQPSNDRPAAPQTASTPAEDQVEIEIQNGELRAPDRIRPRGRHLTLRVRSDEFVIVEVEDSKLSWLVLAGKVALITLDTHPKKHFEAELTRRRGVLVLRLDD